MVKHGEKLLTERSNEWSPYYVNYYRLKELIKAIQAERSESANAAFAEELRSNMKRVDGFYVTQERCLLEKVKQFPKTFVDSGMEEVQEKAEALREDIGKLYAFAEINYDGLRKITKKFDKKVGTFDAEHADSGEHTQSSANSNQDEKLHGLMQHMLSVMDTHPFARQNAERRLNEIRQSLDEWVNEQVWHEPELDDEATGGFRRQVSLVVPLMPQHTISRRDKFIGGMEKIVAITKRAAPRLMKFLSNWKPIWVMTVMVIYFALCHRQLVPDWTAASFLVVWVTMVALVLLGSGLPSDGVVMSATLFLTICGVLAPEDAWAAFSNDVVLSVAGLTCVANVVQSTGVIDIVFLRILGQPRSLPLAMLRLFLPAMILNVCISNTCVMSCLLPVLDKWSLQIGIHKAFFLMPLSFVLLISGVFAIFSTSTNLIAQGMLISHGQPPFNNFDLAVPVLICSALTILYLLVATPFVLRRFRTHSEDAEDAAAKMRLTAKKYDVRIQVAGKALVGLTLESSGIAPCLEGGIADVITCWRYGSLQSITKEFELVLDDVFLLNTSVPGFIAIRDLPGINLLPLDSTEIHVGQSSKELRELVEVVLELSCPLVGHRLVNSHKYFERAMDCSIVGYHSLKHGNIRKETGGEATISVLTEEDVKKLIHHSGANSETRMKRGDHIVFDAPKDFFQKNEHDPTFITVTRLSKAPKQVDTGKALTAGIVMLGMIILVASSTLPLLEAVLLALGALVMTDCAKLEMVRQSVKLNTVLTIVGAFGLGKAIGQEKVASRLADLLIWLLAPFGSVGLLAAVFLATVALGVIFHGTAVVVLMYPLCEVAASKQDLPIHMVVGCLCIAVAMQVLSPISYQTNMMAFSAGGYVFSDFTILGSGLVCVIGLACIPLCQYWFA